MTDLAQKWSPSHFKEWLLERLQDLGSRLWKDMNIIGGVGVIIYQTFGSIIKDGIDWKEVLKQLHSIAVKSLSLVSLIAIFTGMVLALQFVFGLSRFGLQLYTGRVIGIGIARELGPVLTALMVASRVGSGIAAELGSMTVSEQVLAIRAMGANPITKLVVPRIFVTTIATPLLTTVAVFIGVFGGMVVTMFETGVSARYFLDQTINTVKVYDFLSGVSKTIFFGFLIGAIACYNGLMTQGGTKGVGESTTQTVVSCAIAIFIADFFLTKLFLIF